MGTTEKNDWKSTTGKRAAFLEKVEDLIPWNRWNKFITVRLSEREYGIPLELTDVLLRIFMLKELHSIPDESLEFIEFELSESPAFGKFAKVMPDGTGFPGYDMLRRFFSFMRTSGTGKVLMTDFNGILNDAGLALRREPVKTVAFTPKQRGK